VDPISPIDAQLDFIPLDLSSFESITQFVEHLKTRSYKIDLLVNNAGLMFTEYVKTKDGFEMQMGVNHLGHFKLTMLMLPLLEARSKVLTVTSITSRSGTMLLNVCLFVCLFVCSLFFFFFFFCIF
jgi:NAD(P)-dependent dehydrogenase (short-subunit alcohol dehydrogenase family)